MLRSCVLTALLVLAGTAAWAADRTEAERYFRRGNQLYDQGEFEEAARMFKVCVALVPQLPGPYRRLGQSYRRLGRCPEAVDAFLRYLEMRPGGKYSGEIREELTRCAAEAHIDTPDPGRPLTGEVALEADADGARVILDGRLVGRTPVETLTLKPGRYRLRAELEGHEPWEEEVEIKAGETTFAVASLPERQYERPPTPGRLVLTIDPPGAQVLVDGDLVGTSPVPDLEVPEGTHEVRVEHPGFLPETHSVEVTRGGQASLTITLLRLPALPDAQGGGEEAPPPPTAPAGDPALRATGWVLLAAAVVVGLAGATAAVLALDRSQSYQDAGPLSDRASLKAEGETYALVADLAFGSAVAVALGGTVLLYVNPAPAPPPPSVPDLEDHLEGSLPGPRPMAGLALGGTF